MYIRDIIFKHVYSLSSSIAFSKRTIVRENTKRDLKIFKLLCIQTLLTFPIFLSILLHYYVDSDIDLF